MSDETKPKSTPVNALFVDIVNRFADVFGAPLPKRRLLLGSTETGWGAMLNPTAEALPIFDDETPRNLWPFSAVLFWNGFPAGVVDPCGGVIADGSLANLETFKAWLALPQSANAAAN